MSRVAVDVADDTLPASSGAKELAQAVGAMGPCLSENTVLAFLDGQAGEAKCERIDAHIDQCSVCAQLVAGAARDDCPSAPNSGPSQRPTAFAKGSVLAGRFTIVRFVARGGMGEVYEAFDQKVAGRVALKTMLCTLSDSAVAVQRLCEEVKLARRIAHRNVCRIHELHEHRDDANGRGPLHFLAMEFVDGRTLKEALRAGPLPLREAGVLGLQLLRGLGAAHEAGVLHLDFKSQNVMLRDSGKSREALIMDFSLSRAFETEARLHQSERQIVGTPGYISPEQLECRSTLGPPSDIYSFGVVFFEMLTGRLPFEGQSASAVLLRQLAGHPPRPSEIAPGLSPIFDRFVLKCLHREPTGRFADVASALAALQDCVAALESVPAKARQLPRQPGLLPLAAAIALGVGLTSFGRTPPASEPPISRDVSSRVNGLQPNEEAPGLVPHPPQSDSDETAKVGSQTPPAVPATSRDPVVSPGIESTAPSTAIERDERRQRARPVAAKKLLPQEHSPAAATEPPDGVEPRREPSWTPRHAPPRLY